MARHVSYRGATIDMESLSRENEKIPAIGNMKVNARGDQINRGVITKTADQIARDNHRVQTIITNTGLKGKQPIAPDVSVTPPKPVKAKETTPQSKERELPSGDIIVEGDNDGK